jgi:hypothetical protein
VLNGGEFIVSHPLQSARVNGLFGPLMHMCCSARLRSWPTVGGCCGLHLLVCCHAPLYHTQCGAGITVAAVGHAAERLDGSKARAASGPGPAGGTLLFCVTEQVCWILSLEQTGFGLDLTKSDRHMV